jgi:predicted XRE-type DNA-binding protein
MRWKNNTQKKIKRKSLEIQFWLRRRGILQKQIAEKIEISENVVSMTVNGKKNNGRVLKHLRALGVPEQFLAVKK